MALLPSRPATDRYPQPGGRRFIGPEGVFGNRTSQRAVLMGCSLLVIVYSLAVLIQVAWMGDIGVRCIFGTELKEPVPLEYPWVKTRPQIGDTLLAIGSSTIANYTDYIRALRSMDRQVGDQVTVSW